MPNCRPSSTYWAINAVSISLPSATPHTTRASLSSQQTKHTSYQVKRSGLLALAAAFLVVFGIYLCKIRPLDHGLPERRTPVAAFICLSVCFSFVITFRGNRQPSRCSFCLQGVGRLGLGQDNLLKLESPYFAYLTYPGVESFNSTPSSFSKRVTTYDYVRLRSVPQLGRRETNRST